MSEAKNNYAAGDKQNAADLNQMAKNANDGGGFRDGINANEIIAAFRPVFLDDTANEWKYCDANDTTRLRFDGFSLEAGVASSPMKVQCGGIVRGFTGLDAGKEYYVQDDGTIGTTPGTNNILVGVAISTTSLLIIKGRRTANGTLLHSNVAPGSTDDKTTTIGFSPSIIVVEWDMPAKSNGAPYKAKGIAVFHKNTLVASFGFQETNSGTSITFATIDDAMLIGQIGHNNVPSGTTMGKLSWAVNSVSASGFIGRCTNTTLAGAGETISGSVKYLAIE